MFSQLGGEKTVTVQQIRFGILIMLMILFMLIRLAFHCQMTNINLIAFEIIELGTSLAL